MIVADIDELAAVRQRYLEAVAHGASELVVDLRPGCLGLDPPGALAGLELADTSAREPPPIDVTIRAPDGLCVLAGLPVRIAARRIALENVAVVGCTSGPIRVTAREAVELRDVIAMGSSATEYERAAVDLGAAGDVGTALTLERVVFARNTSRDSALGLYCATGAWLDEARLTEVTVEGGSPDAVVALEAVRLLRVRAARLRRGSARVLLRLLWPVVDGELAACALSGPAGGLVEVREETPVVPKLRLTEGTLVTAPLDALPEVVALDATVEEAAGETVDARVDEAIAAAARRVIDVDGRLERLVG